MILANYANLGNFNLVPNTYAVINGLTVTSSDPNIVSVNGSEHADHLSSRHGHLVGHVSGQDFQRHDSRRQSSRL